MKNLFTILLLILAVTTVFSHHHGDHNHHDHIEHLKKKFDDALINLKESAQNLKEGLKGGYEQARETVKGGVDTSEYQKTLMENIDLIGEKIKEGLKGMRWNNKEDQGSEEVQENQNNPSEQQGDENKDHLEYIKGPSFVGQVKENLHKVGEKIKSAVGIESGNHANVDEEPQEEL